MENDTLKAFVTLVKDLPSRSEFVTAFGNVVKRVKAFEDRLTSDFQNLLSTVNKKIDDKLATIHSGKDGKDGKDGLSVQGEKGDKGERGDKGDPGQSIVGPAGKDGRDGSPDMAEDIRNKLELLDGEERLKLEAIRGLETLIEDIKNLKARPSGAGRSLLQLYVNGSKKGAVQYLNITGSGVSYAYANGRNDVTITGSGGSLSVLTATGTVNDSNLDFVFVSKPTLVIVNGQTLRENVGWTWNSGTSTATLSSVPGAGGDVYGLG